MKLPAKTKSRKFQTSRRPPSSGSDDFLSVARRLECDEDKGRFEAKLGKIAKAKPQSQK